MLPLTTNARRCSNLLRLGVVPVAVLEGNPPAAKMETLAKRSGSAGW